MNVKTIHMSDLYKRCDDVYRAVMIMAKRAKQIIDEMMAVQIRYQPDLFVVEEGALKKAIGPFLKDEMLRSGTFIK